MNKKFRNPFRGDTSPGCFFKIYNNTLYFVDFGNIPTHINSLEILKMYYNISTEEAIKKSRSINPQTFIPKDVPFYKEYKNIYTVDEKEFSEFE